jgi:hypothetical protein
VRFAGVNGKRKHDACGVARDLPARLKAITASGLQTECNPKEQ